MTRQKLKLLIGGAAIASAVGYLGFSGVRSGWVYYLDVDQYVSETATHGRRARVHGVVGAEGLDCRPVDLYARFELIGNGASLEVEYRGAIPDMFEPGREVVVEGIMGEGSVFAADVLLTKCASKYEARDGDAQAKPGGAS